MVSSQCLAGITHLALDIEAVKVCPEMCTLVVQGCKLDATDQASAATVACRHSCRLSGFSSWLCALFRPGAP